MQNSGCNPYSQEECESRFQELRAQRVRAKQLFYCYAPDSDAEADDDDLDDDDVYLPYYDELGDEQ